MAKDTDIKQIFIFLILGLVIFAGLNISSGLKDARTIKVTVKPITEKSTETSKITQPIKKIIPVIEFNSGSYLDSILNLTTTYLSHRKKSLLILERIKKQKIVIRAGQYDVVIERESTTSETTPED